MTLAGSAQAQVLYGSLTGNVTDASGAAVPGAKVEALNVGTGVSKQAVTDDRGTYLFSDLQPGTYKVTICGTGLRGAGLRKCRRHPEFGVAPGRPTLGIAGVGEHQGERRRRGSADRPRGYQ